MTEKFNERCALTATVTFETQPTTVYWELQKADGSLATESSYGTETPAASVEITLPTAFHVVDSEDANYVTNHLGSGEYRYLYVVGDIALASRCNQRLTYFVEDIGVPVSAQS
jgi:hypothetical protein